MKKIFVAIACVAMLVSCGQSEKERAKTVIDSLQTVINEKDTEINDLMGTFNEIQAGFDQINAAEGRVNLYTKNAENNVKDLEENIAFLQQTMESNRQKIADLEKKLKDSGINSSKLKEAVNKLSAQLKQKTKELTEIHAQLAQKDVRIAQLGDFLARMADENASLEQGKAESDAIVSRQDAQLNTAWYVYGTKSELKAHKVLEDGDVLRNANFNADYFTKIDIRKQTVFPVKSKYAKVLTTHPEDSYTLVKDDNGLYTLSVTDVAKFWSISKYLVVRVK